MGKLEELALSFLPTVRRGQVYVGKARVAGYTATLAFSVSRAAGGYDLRQCMLHYPKPIVEQWSELAKQYQTEGLGLNKDPFTAAPVPRSMPSYDLSMTHLQNDKGKLAGFDLSVAVILAASAKDIHPAAFMFKVVGWSVLNSPRVVRMVP